MSEGRSILVVLVVIYPRISGCSSLSRCASGSMMTLFCSLLFLRGASSGRRRLMVLRPKGLYDWKSLLTLTLGW